MSYVCKLSCWFFVTSTTAVDLIPIDPVGCYTKYANGVDSKINVHTKLKYLALRVAELRSGSQNLNVGHAKQDVQIHKRKPSSI